MEYATRDIEFIEHDEVNPTDNTLFDRFKNQKGCFTKTKDYTAIESIVKAFPGNNSQYIYKIFIPNLDRDGCYNFLTKKFCRTAFLYPDMDGIVKECNELAYNKRVARYQGSICKISQTVQDSGKVDSTKKILFDCLTNKRSDLDLEKMASEINLLDFKIEDILLKAGYPHSDIKIFMKKYINT